MKQVRTARGKLIDMQALAKANEDMRAVSPGNAKLNARGDRIDQEGNVLATVQRIARTQMQHAQAPEKRKLSDAPGNAKPAKKAATELKETSVIVRQEDIERDDGSSYTETEYDDGSIDVEEIGRD